MPSIRATLLGRAFRFETTPGLFSADRVDDGTRLLLAHLPEQAPSRVLDLGCGYGALALPVAGAHPNASILAVDRDLAAVENTRENARAHGASGLEARGSLGYRDVGADPFDWILCNVPARIGARAIAHFLGAGAARLAPGGEIRIVVIRDLAEAVGAIATERTWPVMEIASGPRHVVFALRGPIPYPPELHEDVYARDVVDIGGLRFDRPHDLGEDPAHVRDAVPLLLELAPKTAPPRVLCHPASYGAVPIALASRGSDVTTVDRDLLAAAYCRRNAARAGSALTVREAAHLETALDPSALFDLAVLEVQPASGPAAAERDVATALLHAPEALVLGPTRIVKDQLVPRGAKILATRGPWSVARQTAPRR